MKNININEKELLSLSTPESCYLLGFIWADGHLSANKSNKNRITIEIISDDMTNLKTCLDKFGKWHHHTRIRPGRKQQSQAIITSKTIYDQLIKWNYRKRHLGTNLPNLIKKSLRHYWYLGVFDGDGCFYFYPKGYLKQCSISSCYNQNWSYITSVLDVLRIKYKITKRIQGKNRHSVIRFCGKNNIKTFGEYIYKNKLNYIGFDRKYKKYTEIVS